MSSLKATFLAKADKPTDKLNLIREKCIAANPEIMELKFGCEIISTDDVRFEVIRAGKNVVFCWGKRLNASSVKTIIGRPIRLADVLLAMCSSDKGLQYGITPDVAMCGRFIFQDENAGTYMGDEPIWNLRADDLREQSEETINFLADLLS